MTETDRIEYKRELSPDIDLEEEAVAFLNRREGGILYIGIDKAGNPVGVKDIDGDILKIKDRLRNKILPSAMGLFDVTVDEVGGVKVIKVFFAGVSIPRNKELMRIFRDLELVESLGSGMGYIMQKYGRENFIFLDNFIRMTVPYITKDREGKPVATVQVAEQVVAPTVQVKAQVAPNEAQVKAQVARHILVLLAHEPLSSSEIVKGLGHKSLSGVVKAHLKNLLMGGFIEMSQPDSPRSPTQKYRLTAKGMAALASHAKE